MQRSKSCSNSTPKPRVNCKWVYQELDSRFRGNDIALKLFAVMPAQAGIQDPLLLRVKQTKSALICGQPKVTTMGY